MSWDDERAFQERQETAFDDLKEQLLLAVELIVGCQKHPAYRQYHRPKGCD